MVLFPITNAVRREEGETGNDHLLPSERHRLRRGWLTLSRTASTHEPTSDADEFLQWPNTWRVYAPPHDRSDATWVEYPGIETDGESIIIFGWAGEECGVRGETRAIRVARAHLIAASPSLLDVCREFLPMLEATLGNSDARI